MELSTTYIYGRLPLILLFMTGYVLYRVIASTGLPEYFAACATRFCRGRMDLLLLSLISVSASLSMFIPNAVTVLAMIPVIRKLDAQLQSMTTPLTLSIIYGANIGGMGSLIGSPANLLLIGALDYFNIVGRDQITFFNWFLWALPLVIIFVLLAWGVACLAVGQRKLKSNPPEVSGRKAITNRQLQGCMVFGFFIGFWSISSMLSEFNAPYAKYEPVFAIVFAVVMSWQVFVRRRARGESNSPLLSLWELGRGVPVRGLFLLIMLGVLIVLVRVFQLDEKAADVFSGLLRFIGDAGQGGYSIYLFTALVVILLTEFLSNTVVSTAFFAVIVHVATSYGISPLPLMILVSTASTCAFMTPVATPCNSLAVGEMRGISIRTMLVLGMILNLLGAILLSMWIWKIVPLFY